MISIIKTNTLVVLITLVNRKALIIEYHISTPVAYRYINLIQISLRHITEVIGPFINSCCFYLCHNTPILQITKKNRVISSRGGGGWVRMVIYLLNHVYMQMTAWSQSVIKRFIPRS